MNEEALYNPDFKENPVLTFAESKRLKILRLEDELKKKIIGQDKAVSAISRAIKRNHVGFKDENRPIASLFFAGTSCVGKTQICKALAEVLYGNKHSLIKLDMSEYISNGDAIRLTGSAPGYVGYENGGQLTNAVKQNSHSVLVFDEIEKAHPRVFDVLLQVLEDGILTSGQGETVSFKDTIIIFTSNIGTRKVVCYDKPIGFKKGYEEKITVEPINATELSLKRIFRPEFLNRIDEVVEFEKLSEKDVLKICLVMLDKVKSKAKKLGITLEFDRSAIINLAALGYSEEYGARPLRRVISTKIEDLLADKILLGEIGTGDFIKINCKKNKFTLQKKNAVMTANERIGCYE